MGTDSRLLYVSKKGKSSMNTTVLIEMNNLI